MLYEARGEYAQAWALVEDFTRKDHPQWNGNKAHLERLGSLSWLAWLAWLQGDLQTVLTVCAESLTIHRQIGRTNRLPPVLSVVAQVAERCGLVAASARLLAAADLPAGVHLFLGYEVGLEAAQRVAVERTRGSLGDAAFAEVWAGGAALSADAAIEFGLAIVAELHAVLATDPAATDQDGWVVHVAPGTRRSQSKRRVLREPQRD
jgi:hypothetical protein